MSTDLAATGQGRNTAPKHGPCPCHGEIDAPGRRERHRRGRSLGLCRARGRAGAASALRDPPVPPHGSCPLPGPSGGSAIGVADDGLPAAAARRVCPALPALRFQQLQFSAPEIPGEPAQAARSGAGEEGDRGTIPIPALHGSGMGTVDPGHCSLSSCLVPVPRSGVGGSGHRDEPTQDATLPGTAGDGGARTAALSTAPECQPAAPACGGGCSPAPGTPLGLGRWALRGDRDRSAHTDRGNRPRAGLQTRTRAQLPVPAWCWEAPSAAPPAECP